MTDAVQEAVSDTAKQLTDCDNHLKICLARLQSLGIVGVNREIELDGQKYLVSVKPVMVESVPGTEKVVVPVGEKQAESPASETGSDSAGISEPLSANLGESQGADSPALTNKVTHPATAGSVTENAPAEVPLVTTN